MDPELLAQLMELLGHVDTAEELDDEALADLTEQVRESAISLVSGDSPTQEGIDQARTALDKVQVLEGIARTRAEEAAARADAAADLLAQLTAAPADVSTDDADADETADAETDDDAELASKKGPKADKKVKVEQTDDATDESTDDADADVEVSIESVETETAETEPVAASNTTTTIQFADNTTSTTAVAPSKVTRVAARTPDFRPRIRASKELAQMPIRASMNAPVHAGEVLNEEKLADVFSEAYRQGLDYRGPRQPVILASIGSRVKLEETWTEDRVLSDNARENERKIQKIISSPAIRAAGGQCAPVPIDYTQPIIGTDARPVRDALARFAADRGGVTLIPPPKFSDVTGSSTVWTHANDITPSSPTTKNVLTMTCPSPVTTYVDAIVTAIKVGNFRQMYWSEQVDAWVGKSAQYAARVAEERLLTLIGTGSTNITEQTGLGTARDVLATLDRASSGFRSRNRVDPGFPLRMIAPFWLRDNIRTDILRQLPGDGLDTMALADAQIESWMARRNINVTWALDGESGQEFSAQTDGGLNGWPSHVIVYLYQEGTWLHLDGGQLNLGVIRDSTLVGTNDFLLFTEFMESAAFHGTESMRLDIDICPSGKTVAATTSFDPCAGGS